MVRQSGSWGWRLSFKAQTFGHTHVSLCPTSCMLQQHLECAWAGWWANAKAKSTQQLLVCICGMFNMITSFDFLTTKLPLRRNWQYIDIKLVIYEYVWISVTPLLMNKASLPKSVKCYTHGSSNLARLAPSHHSSLGISPVAVILTVTVLQLFTQSWFWDTPFSHLSVTRLVRFVLGNSKERPRAFLQTLGKIHF